MKLVSRHAFDWDLYDTVLLDMDGTLLDSLEDIAFAVNAALERMGLPTHKREHYRTAVGDGVRQLVERCLPPDRQTPEHGSRSVRIGQSG